MTAAYDRDYSTEGLAKAESPEMARPYFERQMRVGRRVIFQWDQVKRFGEVCADCHPPNADGKVIEGLTFIEDQHAEAFNLDFLERAVHVGCLESMSNFDSWEAAEAWVFGQCQHSAEANDDAPA